MFACFWDEQGFLLPVQWNEAEGLVGKMGSEGGVEWRFFSFLVS